MKKVFAVILCLGLCGCASVTAYHRTNQDFKNLGSMYVVQRAEDELHLERIIADELKQRGYRASSGEKANVPEGVDILVTYADHWFWDITMYMLSIDIEFRNKQDQSLIASGRSYRPSLERRSPAAMIQESLDKILNNSGT